MKIRSRFDLCRIALIALIITTFAAGGRAEAQVYDAAAWVPQDAMAFVSANDINILIEKLKKTSLYGLYQEPALKAVVAPTEEKIRQKIDEFIAQASQEIGLEKPPAQLPIPEGKAVLAVFCAFKKVMRPDMSQFTPANYEQYLDADGRLDQTKLPQIEVPEPVFDVVVLVDIGSKIQTVKDLAQKAAAKAVEEGAVRQSENIRGVEINIIKPPDQSVPQDICFGFKENWLIGGSNLEKITQVLMRMTGEDMPNLTRQREFLDMRRKLGEADVFAYLNAQPLMMLFKSTVSPDMLGQVEQIIKAMGVESIYGIGAAVQIAPDANIESRVKALVGVRGPKTGIAALLTPKTAQSLTNRLLTKGLESFMAANYQPNNIYNGIVQIVNAVSPETDFNATVQAMMAMTSMTGGGQPPVNFSQEVINQLTGPVTLINSMEKPYTAQSSGNFLLAIGVQDRQVLDNALARIHQTFLAQGDPQMQRELLAANIYVIPSLFGALLGGGLIPPGDPTAPSSNMAFAVAGSNLVFGGLETVEQAIRNVGRENIESINTDPMFQHARRFLPAQAGLYHYQNNQISGEIVWNILKDAARRAAENTPPETDPQRQLTVPLLAVGANPLVEVVRQLSEFVNLTGLPEFALVKKYFGAGAAYLIDCPEGIFMEINTVKAPPGLPSNRNNLN